MFDGNQLCAPIGSLTTKAPSQVCGGLSGKQAGIQPSIEVSASVICQAMLRVAVGLEALEDLQADLSRGLDAA